MRVLNLATRPQTPIYRPGNKRHSPRLDDEPDWVLDHERKQKRQAYIQQKDEVEARLRKIREKELRARQRYESGEPTQKRLKISNTPDGKIVDDESAFVLDDYESDDDSKTSGKSGLIDLGLSVETRALIEKIGGSLASSSDYNPEPDDEMKIFFCSRTHSQLSQFVHELRRVRMPTALRSDESAPGDDELVEEIKHVTLGSRKALCINEKVKALSSVSAINDRCLELQQAGTPAHSKCSFLPNKDNETLVHDFRDYSMARIRDMEDFGKLGSKIGICPYYATRAAVKPAEIVTLPYPLLLQKAAREALNLSLKNHVVIIDEAHNLMDAIANIYSVSLSASQLQQARSQLVAYLQKFRARLKGKNRTYVTQLLRVLDSIHAFLHKKTTSKENANDSVEVGDLLSGKGVDQINLYRLMKYLQESKLARKVDGYQAFVDEHGTQDPATAPTRTKRSTLPVLTHVQSFLAALTNPAPEGRFFYSKSTNGGDATLLKYLLLDPSQHFREIVEEARAVVLAGGTMSPMNDYTNNLLAYLPEERIQTLSCGHVIPPSNLVATSLSTGPAGRPFDFTFEQRKSAESLDELGAAISSFAATIPHGLVVFFPSYAYLDSAVARWQTTAPAPNTLWARLSQHKQIFMEPRSTAAPGEPQHNPTAARTSPVDDILAAYTRHIRAGRGALLLAVIGGSLSEGINFSDDLGRGIVVVGLPFPNANTPEWVAKLDFVRKKQAESGQVGHGDAAKELYENSCMRAVNQSIGRAIRHKSDYAAIMLLDRRYERANIRAKLPGWIQSSLRLPGPFDETLRGLREFFDAKAA